MWIALWLSLVKQEDSKEDDSLLLSSVWPRDDLGTEVARSWVCGAFRAVLPALC